MTVPVNLPPHDTVSRLLVCDTKSSNILPISMKGLSREEVVNPE